MLSHIKTRVSLKYFMNYCRFIKQQKSISKKMAQDLTPSEYL